MEPIVSVVIPTYNHAKFLKEALLSLQKQTLTQWEAVVVNNLSTDNTLEIIRDFDDPRIRVVNFANQGIIAASRNKGIEEARAPYIAFLDSDDYWYPRKLERCLDVLNGGFDAVCHGEDHFYDGTSTMHPVMYGPQNRVTFLGMLLRTNCMSTSAVVCSRQVFRQHGGFATDPRFITAEDYELWLTWAKKGVKIKMIDEILGAYRIYPGSASSSAVRNARASLAVIQKHYVEEKTLRLIEKIMFRWRVFRIRSFIGRNLIKGFLRKTSH